MKSRPIEKENLLARCNCGPLQLSGDPNAFYERHLTFDHVVPDMPGAVQDCSPHESVAGLKQGLNSKPGLTASHIRFRNPTTGDPAWAKGSQLGRRNGGQIAPAAGLPRSVEGSASPTEHSSSEPTAEGDRELLKALAGSRLFANYERAFTEATGLPIALRTKESWQLSNHGNRNEIPFCAFMAEQSRSCGACLGVLEKLSQAARHEPHTVVCWAGLTETAVPVRLGDRLIGFLQTGRVFRKEPTERQFQESVKLAAEWGVDVGCRELRKAYFGTRVMPGKQHASVVKLLSIFAQHLSMLSNQILIQRDIAESPIIAKAKAFIREHRTERLGLAQVAQFVNISSSRFCSLFKKCTGLNFTDYVSLIRLEDSKNLLLNPHLRVSEIAYHVGFQSPTHFGRVFRDKLGQSPTQYRSQLPGRHERQPGGSEGETINREPVSLIALS
ncbi:MAG: helix-turn-helix domain-containing protein [Limisphaerales bacterium]